MNAERINELARECAASEYELMIVPQDNPLAMDERRERFIAKRAPIIAAALRTVAREVQPGVVLERGQLFPSGMKPWFNVHVRVGMQWDHDPSEAEIVEFTNAVVEATNNIMGKRLDEAAKWEVADGKP